MKYLQITVSTTAQCADLVAMLVMDLGSEGVQITDFADVKEILSDKKNWDYVGDDLNAAEGNAVLVSGGFSKEFDKARLREGLERLRQDAVFETGSLEISSIEKDSADYENEWKKFYRPIEMDSFVIVPEWMDYSTDKIKILLDPGLAFGTGNHETTSMCLRLLQRQQVKGKTVADVGCGSGILGITAMALGAKTCSLIDFDAQAIKAAEHNARLNGFSPELILGNLTESFKGRAQILLANLTADILLMLLKDLSGVLDIGARIIVSGIILPRLSEVENLFKEKFELIETLTDGDWAGQVYEYKTVNL